MTADDKTRAYFENVFKNSHLIEWDSELYRGYYIGKPNSDDSVAWLGRVYANEQNTRFSIWKKAWQAASHQKQQAGVGDVEPYDDTKSCILADRQYLAGMKAGWNYGVADDKAGYMRVQAGMQKEIRDAKPTPHPHLTLTDKGKMPQPEPCLSQSAESDTQAGLTITDDTQPEPRALEPVAWIDLDDVDGGSTMSSSIKRNSCQSPVYTAAQLNRARVEVAEQCAVIVGNQTIKGDTKAVVVRIYDRIKQLADQLRADK